MKAIHTLWCGALVFASHGALAQMHQPAQPMPDPQAQSDLATPSNASSGDSSEGSSASATQSEAGADLSRPTSVQTRPKPQVQGDVTYLCGGIGEEEAAYMKSEARGYDMMLTFAAQDGSYLANVNVDVRDAKGRSVLQAKCDAPIMLLDVPKSGTYRIRADASGYTLNRTAKVTAKQKNSARLASVVLTWPQRVAEAPASEAAGATSSGSGSGNNSGSGETGRGTQQGNQEAH